MPAVQGRYMVLVAAAVQILFHQMEITAAVAVQAATAQAVATVAGAMPKAHHPTVWY